MTRLFPPAWIALFAAYALGMSGALGDLPSSPLHEVQLFLADHLRREWWSRFDARWYAGFDVGTVPTLAAQLAALLAKVPFLGLERAYAVVVALTGLVFGLGAVRLSASLRDEEQHGWLTVAVAVAPTFWVLLVPQGALPAALSIGFGLNAIAWARQATRPIEWASTLALAGAAVAAHPLGVVVLIAAAPVWILGARPILPRVLSMVAGGALGLVAGWSSLPELVAAEGPVDERLRLVAATAGVLALAGGALRRAPSVAAVGVAGLLLAGTAHLAPAQLSSFAVLAAAISLSLIGLSALEHVDRWPSLVVALGLLLLTSAWLGWERNLDTRSRRQALREVEWVLANVPDGERHRFITVGIGPEWVELSRRVRPGSISGGLPWRGPNTDTTSNEEISGLLSDPTNAIRWVVMGASGGQAWLEPLGFVSVGAWRGNVTLWERKDAPPITAAGERVKLSWSIAILTPLLGVGALVVLALALVQLARRAPPAESTEPEVELTFIPLD